MRKLIWLMIALLTISGCWDMIEIERRGYVLALAWDKYKPPLEPPEQMQVYTGKRKYQMTIQIPIWKKGQQIPGQGGGGGQQGAATWQLSVAGNSLMEMNREFSTRIGYPPYYEDALVAVFSQELAEEGLDPFLDWMLRDEEIRRTIKVYVTPKEAKKILDTQPIIESYSADYIAGISRNKFKTSKMYPQVSFGDISEYKYAKSDFLVPLIISVGPKEVKLKGAAVFKQVKMVSTLTELEAEAANFLTNRYEGGVITFPCPDHPGNVVVVEVDSAKTEITPKISNDKVDFNIDVRIKGKLAEATCFQYHNTGSEKYLAKAAQLTGEKVERNIRRTLEKLQKVRADATQMIVPVRIKEYQVWKQVKDKWSDEYFPKAEFKVNVQTEINRFGLRR